jgi:putative NIF3 family GTP cyclohydrolase 1 type 2
MEFNRFIDPGFKNRNMGVVLDNTDEIKRVYTAAIPDPEILDKLLATNQTDLLLFSHHAMCYDPTLAGFPFYNIPEYYFTEFKRQRISFYMLHSPLDKNGEYSTSVNLAKHLELEITGEFCNIKEYSDNGVFRCGVVCKTDFHTAGELAEHVRSKVGHDISLTGNGDDIILNNRIAVAAGGGNLGFVAEEIGDLGINMYITGCTRQVPSFQPTIDFTRVIKERKINVIGATHYSTEKYACIAMVNYFEKLGIQAEFLEGRYYPEDLAD